MRFSTHYKIMMGTPVMSEVANLTPLQDVEGFIGKQLTAERLFNEAKLERR